MNIFHYEKWSTFIMFHINRTIIVWIDYITYTMSIKGIDNLEYYTALTALEQETQAQKILDTNGLNIYKNCFIVDAFNGHSVGDVVNPDYNCSIDMEHNECRPFFVMKNIHLVERDISDIQRTSDGYKLTGSLVTL